MTDPRDETLVVGATGQLGRAVVGQLLDQGRQVRALVRAPERGRDLGSRGARLVIGDLRDPASIERAVDGVDTVITTANSTAPRPGDDLATDRTGMDTLIAASERAGVRRFGYPSTVTSAIDDEIPVIAAKRYGEERLAASGLSYVVVRFPMFSDAWLALVGSSLPTRGEPYHTLRRPYPFLNRFRRLTGRLVETRGVMLVAGDAHRRQAFITVADAAAVLVAAVFAPSLDRQIVEAGGPEVLDWTDVARAYERVLGRSVRVVTTPGAVFTVAQRLLRPVSPAAANVMGLNRLAASADAAWSPSVAHELGVGSLTTVGEFLAAKAKLPDDRRVVVRDEH